MGEIILEKNASRQRIGILGGCFDPIHLGHLSVAQLAFEQFLFDALYFIPSGDPPHKAVTTKALHRLAMVEAAIANHDHFFCWDREVKRLGHSYTIDTLIEFEEFFPEASFFYIIGSDNLSELKSWRRYEDILAKVVLCVTERPGYSPIIPPELLHADIRFFPTPYWGVSSTVIRNYRSQGLSARYLVSEPVLSYIEAQGLYHSSGDTLLGEHICEER